MVFGSCSAIQGDQDYFGGPVCNDSGEVDIAVFPRLDGIYPNDNYNMCNHAVKTAGEESILPSDRIDSNTYSHVMWRTLLSTDRPMSCGRRGGKNEVEQGETSSWCNKIRNTGTMCNSVSDDSQINTEDETIVDVMCRIYKSYPPANVVPPAPTVPHTGSRFGDDEPSFFDLTGQSMQFLRCEQQEEDTGSISPRSSTTGSMGVRNLPDPRVVIQLCWKADYELMNYCDRNENYCQDYILDLSTYLDIVARHQRGTMDRACTDCTDECVSRGSWEPVPQDEKLRQIVEEQYYQQQQVQRQSPEFMDMTCDACLQDEEGQRKDSSCWDNENSMMNWYSNSTSGSHVDCGTCYDECSKMKNMYLNGYIEATKFKRCEMLDRSDEEALFAGPVCAHQLDPSSSSGIPVRIGVFLDSQCSQLDPSKRVSDYALNEDGYMMKLSYFMMKYITDTEHSLSCSEDPATYVPLTGLHRSDVARSINQLCSELFQAGTPLKVAEEKGPIILDEIFEVDDDVHNNSSSSSSNSLLAPHGNFFALLLVVVPVFLLAIVQCDWNIVYY